MTIKNPHIIHFVKRRKNDGFRYICITTCSITKSKSTRDKDKVTCKNCKRLLK